MPSCVEFLPPNSVKAVVAHQKSSELFSYDHVADSSANQSEIFETIGKSMADNCLQGYNGTIFA